MLKAQRARLAGTNGRECEREDFGALRTRWIDLASTGVLVGAGVASIVVALLLLVGVVDQLSDRRVITIILVTVGLTAGAIGIERWRAFGLIEARLDRMEIALQSALGGEYVKHRDPIYRHTLAPIHEMESSLITLVVGGPRAPEWWFDAVVDRLARTAASGKKATWQLFVAMPEQIDVASVGAARFQVLRARGVVDQVRVFHVPYAEQTGFDFLIVDHEYVLLTLPSSGPDGERPHRAICHQHAPDLASNLLEWLNTLHRTEVLLPR